MPADARNAFLDALSKITGTGNFHSEGVEAFFPPEIEVKGVGELAFPLPAAQAKALITVAEAAPYGKGTETVRDDAVRKCWQIDAKSLGLNSKPWKQFLKRAVEQVRADLGIGTKVSALPYKLLVYGKGGHFLPHRDTEKLDAMFGTLIVSLPSAHEGGALHIRHGGREAMVDFGAKPRWRDFQFAALFADCEHEVKPVRSGYRCCLIYNLRLDQGDPGLLHLPLDAQAESLLPSLRTLAEQRRGKLSAALLEHSYTETNFSLRNLKGNDRARARALLAAAEELGLVAHLGLAVYQQSGELVGGDDDYYGYRGRRYEDEEEDDGEEEDASDSGEMGEVYEESLTVGDWRDTRDVPVPLGSYRVAEEDLIAIKGIGEGEPDEKESEGYTGNAGCTMDYWYRRAAVVWWAREDHERVLCDYDLPGACRRLFALAGKRGKADQAAFQRLAAAVVGRFPEALPHPNRFARDLDPSRDFNDEGDRDSAFCETLAALARARAGNWLAKLVAPVPAEAFGLCRAPLWKDLFAVFGATPFEPVFEGLLRDDAGKHRGTLFRILDALRDRAEDTATARRILSALVRLQPRPAPGSWKPVREPEPPGHSDEARLLLLASPLIADRTDRSLALAFLLADESLAYLRGRLGPLLTDRSLRTAIGEKGSLFPKLMAFAKEKLGAEVARALKPYPDWTRPCPAPEKQTEPFGWSFRHRPSGSDAIEELASFMADPERQSHDFKRPQHARNQLEDFIRRHFLDLDWTTIKRGTPHTLRVTKNDASYRHAIDRREKDRKLLAKLAAAG